jgi:hypothetical protein
MRSRNSQRKSYQQKKVRKSASRNTVARSLFRCLRNMPNVRTVGNKNCLLISLFSYSGPNISLSIYAATLKLNSRCAQKRKVSVTVTQFSFKPYSVAEFKFTFPIFCRAFFSVVRQMPGYKSQRWGKARTSQFFSFYCYVCSILCILRTVCV